MGKDKLIVGIGGIVVGIVIGFLFANSLNRSATVTQSSSNSGAAANLNLPADHPPVGQTSGPTSTAPLPQVTQAIERAKQKPDDFEAQMTAADLYYQIQRYTDAAKIYEKANQLKPDELEPLIKLGNSYFDAEQYETAEKWYLAALKRSPNDVNVRTDLALTFFLRTPRDIGRAIKEYQAALALKPDNEITLQNLALAYIENGDSQNSQATIEKLRKVNPNNPAVLKSDLK
jgi:tetratricopeptide (TPR) repeat protein